MASIEYALADAKADSGSSRERGTPHHKTDRRQCGKRRERAAAERRAEDGVRSDANPRAEAAVVAGPVRSARRRRGSTDRRRWSAAWGLEKAGLLGIRRIGTSQSSPRRVQERSNPLIHTQSRVPVLVRGSHVVLNWRDRHEDRLGDRFASHAVDTIHEEDQSRIPARHVPRLTQDRDRRRAIIVLDPGVAAASYRPRPEIASRSSRLICRIPRLALEGSILRARSSPGLSASENDGGDELRGIRRPPVNRHVID